MVGNTAADILIASAMFYYVSIQHSFSTGLSGVDFGPDDCSYQNDAETQLTFSITMRW
jgi:methyl coenzyme M reductase beta subunit